MSSRLSCKTLQQNARNFGANRRGNATVAALQRPAVPAADQVAAMADKDAPNRFQDCWVWRGRPKWDDIFANVKKNRQHRDVGVCFCGSPAIGAALDAQCREHSDARDDCVFTLHKENF